MKSVLILSLVSLLIVSLLPLASVSAAEVPNSDFDRTIAPLLLQHCVDCHGGLKPKGQLDLTHRQSALAGGKSGVVLVPGQPEQSLLWEYLNTDRMPPKKPLTAADKQLFKQWIQAGAVWGTDPLDPFRTTTSKRAGNDWWSLQPLARPALPQVRDQSWSRNPIDRFILSKLEAKGLHPSPPADRRTLIRRLAFDLLGLPPSPEEVDAFVQDASSHAYEKLVDRYLNSPQYGVRWARHWLDVVHFGESNGFEFDELRSNAWPYRDWVVHALNHDLPYDEFVRLQLAGDVLRPHDADALKATGFLVAGAYDTVGQTQQSLAMRLVVRQDELEDLVGTVCQTFLGLTANCARCHDHKFDPVRQVEYYRLTAALNGAHHGERILPGTGQSVYAVTSSQPETAYLLVRGNTRQLGEVVTAGGVAALAGLPADFGLSANAPEAERRRRLAAWVTDPRNPLFGRVIVNRLWHYHFGVGLVDTPNDFGFNGGRPTHPELLDWLAVQLQQHHWSLKQLHRLVVLSETYRQSGSVQVNALHADAANRLLWRRSPTRLEAEAVRDAMLSASGQLNLRLDGPGFQDFKFLRAPGTAALLFTPGDPIGVEFNRRTLYRTWARAGRNRLLDAFDCPDPSASAPSRAVTTTPLQALALLNNSLVLRLAQNFGERLEREAGNDGNAQICRAYRLAYGREPRAGELALARQVVQQHGLAVLTRAIFNSNEFLYID
jgi:hypothetical protein